MELKLTEKQRKWAESYVRTGNATQACRDAGYEGNDNSLRQQGFGNVKHPKIQAYIANVLGKDTEAEEDNRIATIKEVMQFYTSVMRGEVKDQFGLDVQMSDRIKAAQNLDKILQMAQKREADNVQDDLIIIQQYGRATEENVCH